MRRFMLTQGLGATGATCPSCNGTGVEDEAIDPDGTPSTNPCESCDGTGEEK